MRISYLINLISFGIFLGLCCCASIPQEAPELSMELGNHISAIEDANIILLHRYFDQKRADVDKFIENEWIPSFADELFSDPTISQYWETIVQENNRKDRLKFITKLGPMLQEKINRKRIELIQPLDGLENQIEEKIRYEYTQARAMNNSITSFLVSAAKVTENQNRYLKMFGNSNQNISNIIQKTDDAVSDLLKNTNEIRDKTTAAQKYLEKLKSIKDSMK